jgi:hypothetical protein
LTEAVEEGIMVCRTPNPGVGQGVSQVRKEVIMKRMRFTKWFGLSLVVLLLFPLANALAENGDILIGEEVSFFTLSSTEDRAINYLNEYYGKHHLILTFFPAAFTPT